MEGSSPFIEAWETSPENAFHYKPRKMHLHAFLETIICMNFGRRVLEPAFNPGWLLHKHHKEQHIPEKYRSGMPAKRQYPA